MSRYLGYEDASRTFALGGILLLIVGMLLGEIYAIYVSHVANGVIKQAWAGLVDASAKGDTQAIREYFAVIYDLTAKRGRFMNSHSHIGAFGLFSLALAIIQPLISLPEKLKRRLAIIFLCGAVLQVSGVYVSYYVDAWILYFSDLGAVMMIVVVIMNIKALYKGSESNISFNDLIKEQLKSRSSRYLVKAGVLLILLGMIFGLYFAWELVSHEENIMYEKVEMGVTQIDAGQLDEARQLIADFKRQQSKIAITAAAHSHAIEFGFLMILLAFVQNYVFLKEKWRLFWARLLSVGGYMLPVCVFLATIYGLRAAAGADTFGALALISLSAMGIGVVRQTGVMDNQIEGGPDGK